MIDKKYEKYTREEYTMEEEIFEHYKEIRKAVNDVQNLKYSFEDKLSGSPEFKAGFIAGVKIMSSIFMDM